MPDPIIDDLADLMPDDLTFRVPTTRNAYGTVTAWGPATTVKCRVVGRTRLVRTPQGKEVVSSYHVVVDGYYDLTTDSEYTLPTRFVPRVVDAVAVQKSSDENGPHHERVFFP